MKKRLLFKVLLLGLTVLMLLSSCYFHTPGSQKVAGISGYAERGRVGFSINLAAVEVSLYLGNTFGVGIFSWDYGFKGLITKRYIPFLPGISIQILPVVFRNIFHRPFLGAVHILIISIRI